MFSGIIARRFFNICKIRVDHFCDRADRTKLHFRTSGSSLFHNLKNRQSRDVELIQNHVRKIHRYRRMVEIIRMSFFLTKENFIRQKLGGIAEISHHWLAYQATNGKTSIKIPQLYELRRRKYFGLVVQDELLTEHISNTMNIANYLHLAEKNTEEKHRIVSELFNFMLVMAKSGIMHLDFRPENILASKNGDIFIIDWEYAAVLQSINPGAYSSFAFGYFCHMLNHTTKTDNVNQLESIITEVMGSHFNKEIFDAQVRHGLGRRQALKQLLLYTDNS